MIPGARKTAVNKIIVVLPSWYRQSKWSDRYKSNHHTNKCTNRNVAISAKAKNGSVDQEWPPGQASLRRWYLDEMELTRWEWIEGEWLLVLQAEEMAGAKALWQDQVCVCVWGGWSRNAKGQCNNVLRGRESVRQKENREVDRAWRHSGEGFDFQPEGDREPLES